MGKTNIEWTDKVWNCVRGCSRVSEGCRNCYAERIAARFSKPIGSPFHEIAVVTRNGPRWTGKVELIESKLSEPLHWKKPQRVFVNSMSDLFHEALPDDAIDRVFAVMALCPHITFQILTKRPERMREWLSRINAEYSIQTSMVPPVKIKCWPLPNVWLGVSVEDQATAEARIPLLLQTPAAIRFVSAEPLLSPVDLSKWLKSYDRSRTSFPGSYGDRGIFDRRSRSNLETPQIDSGEPTGNPAVLERSRPHNPGREIEIGRLPNCDVFGRTEATQNIRSQSRMDGECAAGHPTALAGEPQEWTARRYSPDQSGMPNSIGECSSRNPNPRQEEESSVGGSQLFGQDEFSASDAGSRTSGENIPIENCSNVRDKTRNSLGDHPSQELGASGLNWVICGGESGPGARPPHPDWFRQVRDQCIAADVAFFFKQYGEFQFREVYPVAISGGVGFPEVIALRVGKKKAGALLDGREWKEFPSVYPVPYRLNQ
jgi:protein gp37